MDAILQNWPILVAGALGGITTLGSGLATRRYYLQWRAKRKRLLLIAYNRKQARLQKGTIDGTTVLVDAEAEVRPRAIARMASLVLLVLDFGDWVRTLPFKLIDMMLGIVGRMASLVDPAVTRNKSLKECVKEARIAWRRRFAPAREAPDRPSFRRLRTTRSRRWHGYTCGRLRCRRCTDRRWTSGC